jgi:Tol biopolymer transport system component
VTEALEAVIAHEPDWELLPASAPPYLVHLLRRCLTKDPKLRLRDIGEARIAIETGEDTPIAPVPARSLTRLVAGVSIASSVVLAAVLAVVLHRTSATASRPAPPVRFPISPPQEEGFFTIHPAQTFFALSPDGSRLAFLASTESAPTSSVGHIWVRAMAELEAKPLNGSDGATSPFWSPDGRRLAFSAKGKLKRTDLGAGSPMTVCDLPSSGSMHGTWGVPDPADPEWPGGVILLGTPDGESIYAVPAAGGTPHEILTPSRSKGEARVLWPWFLPDGRRFLYTVFLTNGDGELRVGQLARNGEGRSTRSGLDVSAHTVMPVNSNTQWIEPDIVLFVRESVLMAQRVNLETLKTVDAPFQVANRVEYLLTTSRATFSASYTGAIAYHAGGNLTQLVWVDQNGHESGTIGSPADYENNTRLSHDGQWLLTERRQPGLGTYDIWRRDLIRDMEAQVTFGRGTEQTPLWIEGDRAIVFAGDSDGTIPHLFKRDLATGVETSLLPPGLHQLAMDVLPGGRAVAYAEQQPGGVRVFQLPLAPGASPTLLLPPHFNAGGLRVSPDGRALAFRGGTGARRRDLYVAPLPMTGEPVVGAANISGPPRWSADGRHLYYFNGERSLMTIPVRTSPSLTVGMPEQLFELKWPAYLAEVSRDGRFLLLVPRVRAAERPIIVDTATISSAKR